MRRSDYSCPTQVILKAHLLYQLSSLVSSLFDSQVIHKYNNMSAVITINILQFYGGVNDSNIVGRKKKIEKGMGEGNGT